MSWKLPLLTLLAAMQVVAAPNASETEHIATMYATYRAAFPDVPEVTVETLDTLKAPVFVDVRTAPEQAVSMLPGALTIEEFTAQQAALAGRPIVAYCTIGARSGEWAQARREEGIEAYNLVGSLLAWTHAGGALEAPDGSATKRVHVYGKTWDLAADGYESTW
ncbi:MAG: rhodanese-related sulfurtransferase [Myxococcota bacterium]|jgi:rhodanese-related sulfurtransferase